MKRFFVTIAFALLVVAGSGLTVTGCAGAASGASPVYGTWHTGLAGFAEATYTFTDTTWTLNAVVLGTAAPTQSGTYTYDTVAKTITLSYSGASETFTYDVSGNTLTLTDSDSAETIYTRQ
jgi:hypothetical protein